jgi:murein DD-endopeptidase MepM/ murein hydrolase activator NlpD
LVYSETLEEWTTHLGIDIKANKASSVSASEAGTVKSIKNDPRYGLTITISHQDGYETVYSNLLSADFVAVGDMVEQGQSIGTVGESASFEVAEVPHLHFEIYKDGEAVNPTTLLK